MSSSNISTTWNKKSAGFTQLWPWTMLQQRTKSDLIRLVWRACSPRISRRLAQGKLARPFSFLVNLHCTSSSLIIKSIRCGDQTAEQYCNPTQSLIQAGTHNTYTSHTVYICNAVITIAIRLRYDYDALRAPASIRRDSTRAKSEHVHFCRSRIVVVLSSNRNCDIGLMEDSRTIKRCEVTSHRHFLISFMITLASAGPGYPVPLLAISIWRLLTRSSLSHSRTYSGCLNTGKLLFSSIQGV